MSKPLHEQMETALADLRAQQARIREAGERMKGVVGTASSKDRVVTANVDGQGRLVDFKLDGTRYRELAPAELSARILQTVREAQDSAAREAAKSFNGLLPAGLGGVLDGGFDLDSIFEDAVSAAAGPLFSDETGETEREKKDG